MKFALNHHWRFDSTSLAFISCFCQIIVMIYSEALFYLIVVLEHDIIEVIMNFMALYFICKLDEMILTELNQNNFDEINDRKYSPLRTI